ncbi:MAG TPA: acetate--CoA ligase family protein [Terriglobales bacterium]|nr:acetate--CoA ligase family protein [Terriglobales bacterium]
MAKGNTTLTEPEAQQLCRRYSIPVPRSRVAHSQSEAREYSKELGFPLVAKIVSRQILHKTEAGGVVIGIKSPEEAERSFEEISRHAKSHSSNVEVEGVLFEQMHKGVEIIAGAATDGQFDKTIIFGAGGILVELLRDITIKLAPITTLEARNMLSEIQSQKLLSGFRGNKPLNRDAIVKILDATSRMITENPEIVELDLNPIIANENEAIAVDARVVLTAYPSKRTQAHASTQRLSFLFKPQSVAIIGASSAAGKIGHEVLKNIGKYDYKGAVFPINPASESILGIKAYANILDVPTSVDLAVLTTPAKLAPTIVSECGKKGVKVVVIVSGGFKEAGSADIEKQTVEAARKYGIRIIGPNCIGVFDGYSRLDTFFQSHERMMRPKAGPVSFITQSGTFGATILEWAAESDIGISKFVSYGNRCDVDEGDLVEFFGNDPETSLIGVYVEGLDDGRKLYDTARKITSSKPIVVLKAGKTGLGSNAAKSHTGWLAGSYPVAEAAFRQAGMIVADNLEDFFDKIKALTMQPLPSNTGLVMVTNGAGPCVMAADQIERLGLTLATLSPTTKAKLTSTLPPYCLVTDTTIDLTGSATSRDYHTALTALAEDPNVGVLMPFFVFSDTPLDENIVNVLDQVATSGKTIIACASGGPYSRAMSKRVESTKIPVYETGERAVAAVEALVRQAKVSGRSAVSG